MARRKIPAEVANESFNMTPMIDVVFQLIIFFMLVTDMSRAQLESLVLPTANKAIKEKFEDPSMLVLNIMPDGTIRIAGKTYWSPKNEEDNKKLEDVFDSRRQNRAYQEVAGDENFVRYPVLIRADRSTPFEHIQKILMIASQRGGVTRVQLGAKQEGK